MPRVIKILVYIVLILLILFVLNRFVFKGLKNAVFSVFSPIEKALFKEDCVLCKGIGKIFDLKNLKNENRALVAENLILKSRLAELNDIEKENEVLRQALDLGLEDEYTMIVAEIVAKKPEMDAIVINKGSNHGVVQGMAVITKENVLVGKVEAVMNRFSQVVLISEDNFSFSVKIGEHDIMGVAKGKGNFNVKIELLPKDSSINIGDVVVSSLLGGTFPKNLLVGEIGAVQRRDPEPFQGADIVPYFLQSELKYLFLLQQ